MTADQLTVNAIAGNHVVLLGLDTHRRPSRAVLGFAIRREDHTAGEAEWMPGMKTFPEADPGRAQMHACKPSWRAGRRCAAEIAGKV